MKRGSCLIPAFPLATSLSPVKALLPLLALFMLVLTSSRAGAQFSYASRLIPQAESRLWIDGSTTVSDFTCQAESINGYGTLSHNLSVNSDSTVRKGATVKVQVPVKQLNCGKKPMNKDMYNALKADDYPRITYTLDRAQLLDRLPQNRKGNTWFRIKTVGDLKIAGVKRSVEMVVKARMMPNEQYEVMGDKKINMRDFGIEPPSKVFGLVKADEEIVVNFQILVSPAQTVDSSAVGSRMK